MLKTNYKNKVWSRLTWAWIIACLLSITSSNIHAQCNNGSAYGSITAPTAGLSETIGCQYGGEYGTVSSVAAGAYFKSTSTVTTDYVTVRQGTSGGTVIAFGPQPLYWQATVAGTYYIHCNTNAACGTQNSCRDMVLTSMVGCTNSSAYGTVTAPTNTTPEIIGCQYGGEYGTVNSVQAAKTYVSASTISTDYITVHMGSYNGPIVAAGLTPLTWTSVAGGTYYVHCNTNAACGTQNSCRDMSIYCTNCLTACSGAPAASNTLSSANPVCGGTGFNLSLSTNYSTLGNIFYQWQSSPDNVTYTDINLATAATYTATQTVATWYRCVVSCGSGGPSTNSTPLEVTMNTNFIACYCIPTTTNGCGSGDHITNVTFAGINNTTGNCISGGSYSNYLAQSGSVVQLSTYTLNVTVNNGGTEYAAGWIDFDHSGTFDASEFIAMTGSLAGSWNYSGSITIPVTALTGNTGFRVRSSYNATIASNSSCATYSYGETEDYTLNIIATTACAGTPNPGNTQSTAAAACPSQNFTLSLQTAQTATGINFDWQSSPDGTTWTSTGGTSSTYLTSQTSDTYYQCIVTCTNSGQSATSTPIQVTMSPFYNCYCTAGLGGSCGINALSSVAVATTTLNNVTGGCTGTYNSFPQSGSTTASFVQGVPYTMTAGCISGSNTQVAIWIDYNQNGIYEVSEYTLINGNIPSGGTGTGSFTVPVSALSGNTGMRVRSDWQGTTAWTAADACTNRTWGETEDYTVTIVVAGACSGTPAASATTASVSNACPGGSVTLGTNPVYTDGGLTFDWQSSPDGVTYTSTGVTTQGYTVTGFSATTYYQCIITCTNSGGGTTTSTPVQVTLNPFYTCYCNTNLHTSSGPCINQIDFNTLSNNTAAAACALPAYSVQSATTTVVKGSTYTFTRTSSGTGAWTGVWIDYNQSGTFDASEYTLVSSTGAGALTNSVSITIPMTALDGNTGMRIRQRTVDMTSTDACTQSFGSGETEDYTVNIQAPVACSGTPNPGNTTSSSAAACPSQNFTLGIQNAQIASNITYNWQSSPDGTTWTSTGGTGFSYSAMQTTTTWYQCIVTCTNSGQSATSTPIQITMNPFYNCYCTTNLGGICGTQSINSVEIATTTLNNVTNGCSTPYNAFPATGSTTATLIQGSSYDFTVGTGNNGNPAQIAVWIDYNQNGIYDASEYTLISASSASGGSSTLSVAIPLSALTGSTGMRIRSDWESSVAFDGTIACDFLDYGETEDYTVIIAAAVACTGTPAAANSISSANPICPGINFTLTPSTIYTDGGLTFDWQSSPDGITYTSTGATNQIYTTSQLTNTYYQLIVTCTNSSQSITTTPLLETVNSVANCYCTAGATTNGCSSGDEYIGNVEVGTINNASTCPPSNQYSDFTAISTDLVKGTTYPASVLVPNWFNSDMVSIWIDMNQDGSFNNSTEQFALTGGGTSGSDPFTGSITIPGTAMNGNTRMRVRVVYTSGGDLVAPCGTYTYGEVEDYTVNIAPPTCVLTPTYPANGTNGCPDGSNITLSWPSLAGATGYDVYFGSSTPPTTLVSTNQSGLTFNADISGGAPTYYWMVVPQITGGGSSCTIWSFGLNPAPDPIASSGGDPCEGTTLGLSGDNNAAGQTSGNTYQWTGPASFSSTQQNPTRSNALTGYAGTYTLTLTNQFLCSATTTVDVAVHPNPTLSVVSSVNVGCISGSDGEMTVVANTTAPYDYTTDFVNFNQDGYFTGLPTGSTMYYVSDALGCAGQGSFNLGYTSTVPPSQSVVVPFIGMPTNVCNGTSVVLSIPPVSNTTKYIWDAPGAAYFNGNPLNVSPFITTTPTVQITYDNPTGSLYVTGVQAANGCGQSLRKIQKSRGTISVPASVSGATTKCASTSGTYTTPAVDAASSYEWTITGDAIVSGTGTTATVTFGPAWNGGILCVAAKTSCYKSPTKCITIGTNASLLNAISGSFTACPNQTLSYSVPASTGAASYSWTLPSGATGSSTTNSISAAFGAGYSSVGNVCVSVTSICGVTSPQKCKTVAPGLPSQPSSISGALSGVCNQTIVYSCPPVSGTTYTWTTPSGTIIQSGQGTSNISAQFSALTTGSVCVAATNSCGSSISRCVPVKGAPNSPGAITPTPSSWCAGDQVEFVVSTSAMSGAFTLNWAYPPASVATYVIGGGNSNSLILDWIGGSGAVNVTANNSCGGATKPSSWSSSCREGAVAEVNALNVSPNPTTGILNINYTATKGTTRLMVLDLAGRLVMTQNNASIEGSNQTQLDMSKLAKGAYMLSVQSTQGNKQVRVVVE